MYSEWASLQRTIQSDNGNTSVLHSFPEAVGKDVANVVVRSLAQNLSIGVSNSDPSNLSTDKEVKWTMEVLCYGLSLPLSEHDAIRDCVNVYCEWMSALTTPKTCVPRPVLDDPNPYMQLMMNHMYNVFVPREGAGSTLNPTRTKAGLDLVNRQTILCHRVLRNIQDMANKSTAISRETWDSLLLFLLAINDALLAPPIVKDGIGDQLCERVLSVLFEMWLLACSKSFPSPPLWKTFREMCANWRHHEALIMQWHRVNMALASKLLRIMYGPDFPQLHISEEDQKLLPESMDNDCIAQCWFRFLHLLSNPVDLSAPQVISNTPKFLHMALTSESVIDPHQHECLRRLPQIFQRAMRGISVLLDAFLGISQSQKDVDSQTQSATGGRHTVTHGGSTPPGQRKQKGFGIVSQSSAKASSKSAFLTPKQPSSTASTPSSSPGHVTLEARPPLAPNRPKVNSILHLFGAWLVEAAITGVKVHGSESNALSRRTASIHIESDPARPRSNSDPLLHELDTTPQSYEAGRAEACGALCRIACSVKTGEDILPVYLSRFYIALHYGLQVNSTLSGQVLANIIFNSSDLLRVDLDGVMLLVPQILKALELILSELTPAFRSQEVIPPVQLRRASIHLMLSMLCLPLHFRSLAIKDLFGRKDFTDRPVTFLSLKMQMIELLLRALTVETDSANTQMLLGGLLLSVQDLALCEEAEQTTAQETEDMCNGPPSPSSTETTSSGPNTDSAHGLFGHAASLVCHRLMASWKVDLNVALAAIEVLSGLAKVKLNNPNALMCKRTVNWICEFIVYQCSRPAPAHSKDLHSMIVAAFHCLTLWLVDHEYLMQDKECLQCVLEVVELGISGSKSQARVEPEVNQNVPNKKHDSRHEKESKEATVVVDENRASDDPKLKGDKELKPVSMRVKDAAEGLLTAIMDQVGSFPPPCGPESVCSLLDEESLLKYCKDGGLPEQGSPFRYFVLDGSTIVALLEQPLGNEQDPLPTVTAIIRGPFGRHAWTMQLRHIPRHHKVGSKAFLSDPGRPTPNNDVGVHHNVKHRCFPEIVDQIPLVQADRSIPKLDSIVSDKASELVKLQGFIRDQMTFENKVREKVKEDRRKTSFPNPQTECKPPSICHEFQTARLFLSHYGFLSLEALKDPTNSSLPPSLVMLDTAEAGFRGDLEALDNIPCRTSDTLFVFYVKAGQKTAAEILGNVTSKRHVQPTFLEFLRSLGWPVDVKKHAGWTGHVSTSWKTQDADYVDNFYPGDTGGSLYDGRLQVLYWADVGSEIAFVVPSPDTFQPSGRGSLGADKSPVPGSGALETTRPMRAHDMSALKPKSLSLDLEKPPERPSRGTDNALTPTEGSSRIRRLGRHSTSSVGQDTKIYVVWLENYEDHENFPAGDFSMTTHTGLEAGISTASLKGPPEQHLYIIFVHALQTGLFRIHMQGQTGKMSMAIPLVDGMVVSRRTLGCLVRQTAINICRRRRLENDAYQPPHVRRKLKIKEVVDKYRNKLIEPEFYTTLFQDVAK